MHDLIHDIMIEATRRYGGDDRLFNAANFSVAFREKAGSGLDGLAVQTIISGRDDVEKLPGGKYYRLLSKTNLSKIT